MVHVFPQKMLGKDPEYLKEKALEVRVAAAPLLSNFFNLLYHIKRHGTLLDVEEGLKNLFQSLFARFIDKFRIWSIADDELVTAHHIETLKKLYIELEDLPKNLPAKERKRELWAKIETHQMKLLPLQPHEDFLEMLRHIQSLTASRRVLNTAVSVIIRYWRLNFRFQTQRRLILNIRKCKLTTGHLLEMG